MRAMVFAGPSLTESTPDHPEIVVAGPAIAGDVMVAVDQGAQIIGLIDARFENEQTVRHDELIYALHSGVHVLGAASMGALRAVECAPFGMRGHGRVFEMYRDGEIDGDHEVALQFGPAEMGWPGLSVPLVNIRATLERATGNGSLTESEAAIVLQVASSIFYKDLTWDTLRARLPDPALRERVAALIPQDYVDLKAQDAEELLATIGDMLAEELRPFVPRFDFTPTAFWEGFAADQSYRVRTSRGSDADVLDELRLDPVRYSDVLQRAFARRTAVAERAGPSSSGQLDAFRAELGLVTGQGYRNWLVANRTDEAGLLRFLENDAELDRALEEAAPALEKDMLDELRAEDQFTALDARAAEKRALLGGRSADNVPSAFADFDLNDLLEWFCRNRRVSGDFGNPDDAARSLGLPDRKALHVLLRREFEYVQATNGKDI